MNNQPVMLITGTRKGIGRRLVAHYLRHGWKVIGCSRDQFTEHLEGYYHFVTDVTKEAEVRRMVREIDKKFRRLDALVNNAGTSAMNLALTTPMKSVQQVTETNFYGTFLVCREAARIMVRRRYGRIVNIASIAAPMRIEGESVYAASKAAIITFTQILAKELAPFNITCNVVSPTPIQTDLIASVPKEKIDALVQNLAVKRIGTWIDVANVVDFFIRPESDYITAQVIALGGV